jgi:hypothetical protein
MKLNEEQQKVLLDVWARDLAKPELEQYELAQMLELARKSCRMSMGAFCKHIGMAKTTYFHKVEILKYTPDQYTRMKENGLSPGQIHSIARTGKEESNEIERTALDFALKGCITTLRQFSTHKTPSSTETKSILFELRNILNRIEMYMDK